MIDFKPVPLPPPFSGLIGRRLGASDREALEGLRRAVVAALDDPNLYRLEAEAPGMIANHLGDKGVIIGVFAEGALIAYGALGLPGSGDLNRGTDLGLPEAELPLVAHLQSAMVLPAYRGRRLHRWLLDQRVAVGTDLGRRHFFTTVAPHNHPSWGNMVSRGLFVKGLVVVGGGAVRCLLHRDLQVTAQFDGSAAIQCALPDLGRQRTLLAAGLWVWDKGRSPTGEPCMVFGHPTLMPAVVPR